MRPTKISTALYAQHFGGLCGAVWDILFFIIHCQSINYYYVYFSLIILYRQRPSDKFEKDYMPPPAKAVAIIIHSISLIMLFPVRREVHGFFTDFFNP